MSIATNLMWDLSVDRNDIVTLVGDKTGRYDRVLHYNLSENKTFAERKAVIQLLRRMVRLLRVILFRSQLCQL